LIEYKVEINRDDCISCGVCYGSDPDHFEEGEEGKSKVIKGQTNTSNSSGTFKDEGFDKAKEAESSCPVSVIKVTKLNVSISSGKRKLPQ